MSGDRGAMQAWPERQRLIGQTLIPPLIVPDHRRNFS